MNVILLAEGDDRPESFAERLAAAGCGVEACVGDVAALAEILDRGSADVVVVDLARPDRRLVEAVGALCRHRAIPVAVFVEKTDPEAIRDALRAGISSYVVRGSDEARLRDALEVARARFDEERALREELASVRSSLADRKVIEQAKGRLMELEGLDEQAAYDALRRWAMRQNCRIIEVARALLSKGPG